MNAPQARNFSGLPLLNCSKIASAPVENKTASRAGVPAQAPGGPHAVHSNCTPASPPSLGPACATQRSKSLVLRGLFRFPLTPDDALSSSGSKIWTHARA